MTDPTAAGQAAPPQAPVLIVDDDARIRNLLRALLEGEGITVTTAADGPQALDLARNERPAVVLLDMGLPLLDGAGVATGLAALPGGAPPILLITADGNAAAKAQRVGAYAYLQKPFDLDEVVELVQRGLGM